MNKVKILVIAVVSLGWMACINEDSQSKGPVAPGQATAAAMGDSSTFTTIQWIDSVLKPATVIEGQQVDVVFRFKNTGDKPLVIESAQPSCGCTIASKPEQPVMPGQLGEIKAVFNSEGRRGTNHKTITVHANTKPTGSHIVEFNVDVIGKDEGPRAADTKPTQF